MHTGLLLQRIYSETQSRLKEIQMATNYIDDYISNLERCNFIAKELWLQVRLVAPAGAMYAFSVRAFDLQQHCQPIIKRGVPEFKFHFRQSELDGLLDEDCFNLIGEIESE